MRSQYVISRLETRAASLVSVSSHFERYGICRGEHVALSTLINLECGMRLAGGMACVALPDCP